ncbi:MAG: tetratricopeptide repeat protein, partial [Candidatus Coatesbacteria bacterium]|nr:tetratricopeptide repeat protein [Candidatus Coatesbacteria bacterium]
MTRLPKITLALLLLPAVAALVDAGAMGAVAQDAELLEELREGEGDEGGLGEEIERLSGADIDKVDLIRRYEREGASAQLEAMAQRDFISAMDKYNLGEYYYDKYERSLKRDETSQAEGYLADAQTRYEEAVEEIEFIDDYYPDFSKLDTVLFIWGDSLYKLEDYRDAVDVLERLLSDYPSFDKTFDAYYKLGECHFAREDFEEAEGYYERIIKNYPNQTDRVYRESLKQLVWINRHNAFDAFEDAEYRRGLSLFLKLLEDPYDRYSEAPEAVFYAGECYFYLEEREEARERYDTIRNKYPDYSQLGAALSRLEELSQLYFTEAMEFYLDKDYPIAAERLQFIAEKYPTSSSLPEILYRWGDSLYEMEDFQGAQRAFIRCKKDHPDSIWALYALNVLEHMSYRSDFFSEADKYFTELSLKPAFTSRERFQLLQDQQGSRFVDVMDYDELNDSSRYVVGMSYYRLRKYDQAVQVVKGINPSGEYAIYASYLAGLCQVKQNLLLDAVESFKQMANAPTTEATERLKGRAHIILAYLYQRLERYDEAWFEYEQIDYGDIENWDDAQVGMAYLLVRNGEEDDFKEVIAMMRGMLRRMPYTEMAPDAYILIGYCELQLGEYVDAADTFEQVIDGYTIDRELMLAHPRYQELVESVNSEFEYINSVIIHEIQSIRDSGGNALFKDELDQAARDAEDLKNAIVELQQLISGRDIIGRDITDDAEFFRAYTSFAHMQDMKQQRREAADEYRVQTEQLEGQEEQLALQAEERKIQEARAMGISEYEMKLQDRQEQIDELSTAHIRLFEPTTPVGENGASGMGEGELELDGETTSPDGEGETADTADGEADGDVEGDTGEDGDSEESDEGEDSTEE